MSTFNIFGRIIDRNSGLGIPNLRVEVWDKDRKRDDLCGTAVTNADGNYKVVFDQSAFALRKSALPDIYFRVFQQDKLIECTKDSVRKNVSSGDTEINLALEIASDSTAVNLPEANSVSEIEEHSTSEVRSRPKPTILATGLEDYSKWKAMYKDHQRKENEPPFRRGRIWA